MNAVVMGHTGLLGRAVRDHLMSVGVEVACPGRRLVDAVKADYVFDCSGESRTYRFRDCLPDALESSLLLAVRNATLARASKAYVYVSSSRVYRVRDGSVEYTSPCHPRALSPASGDMYGEVKAATERLLIAMRVPNLRIFRMCGLYGPGLRKGPVFDLVSGLPLRMTPDSDLQLLHTSQASRAMLREAQRVDGAVVTNIGSQNSVTLSRLGEMMGLEPVWTGGPEAYEMQHVVDRMHLGPLASCFPRVEDGVEMLKAELDSSRRGIDGKRKETP